MKEGEGVGVAGGGLLVEGAHGWGEADEGLGDGAVGGVAARGARGVERLEELALEREHARGAGAERRALGGCERGARAEGLERAQARDVRALRREQLRDHARAVRVVGALRLRGARRHAAAALGVLARAVAALPAHKPQQPVRLKARAPARLPSGTLA